MLRWLAAIVVAVSLSASHSAYALGLGEITTRSALNEPLQAEISLLGATRDELTALEIRLASAETFERYGIDKPSYLNRLRFRVRGGDTPTVEITSSQPITEPFVTMLVEAVWPRGRLLREYTVLLDPPTYAAAAAAPAPAPVTRAAPTRSSNAGNVRRAPSSQSSAAAPLPLEGDQYRVQRRDTLWEIAERIQPDQSVSINQVMLAIYQANPQAFDGNINRLSAGAVLRLPTEQQLFSINRAAALEEVRRQNRDWQGGSGSLTLVPPDQDTSVGTTSGSATGASGGTATTAELEALRRELAEKERLIALRNEELARLQATLSNQDAAAVTTPEPVSTDDLFVDDPATEQPVSDDPLTEDEIFVEDDTAATAQDSATEVTEPEPVAQTPAPATRTPAVVTMNTPEPGLMDTILGNIWYLVGGGVVVILGLLALLARRRSSDSDPTGTWEALDAADLEDLDGTLAATGRLRELGAGRSVGDTARTPVSDSLDSTDTFEATAPVDKTEPPKVDVAEPAAEDDTGFNIEDTFSSDTAINLDQSDPLAEADFHMAYGLYDQAADLVKGALAIDSSDVKLKAKLCEIYFVWGNQDGFVAAAEDLKGSVPDNDAEWNKVVIMGQQIAPAHALFSGAVASSEGGELDLSFDGADADAGAIDSQISGDDNEGFGEVFDKVGDSGDTSDGGTVEQLADISGIDFEFDEASLAGDEPVVGTDPNDASGLDFQFDGESLEQGTVEQPIDITGGDMGAGDTAEMDVEDLDLNTGNADVSDTTGNISSDLLDATGVTSVLPDDFKVSLPEEEDPDATVLANTSSVDLEDTGTSEMLNVDSADAADATGIMPAAGGLGEADLDVADLTSELRVDDLGSDIDATAEQPAIDSSSTLFSEEVFVGDADSAADTGLNLAIDEDTAQTNVAEVGTKLDLARAYVDMGDPDGARSILEEVLTEGDDSQKAEAQSLLDGLS
ncbi:MAG: FimV/HubP family polar landmark protein [Pseudomonadota bacterium]